MTSSQIREAFVRFFTEKGCKPLPGSSLVPQNDPSLLFVNAGMNQFKDVFAGDRPPPAAQAVTVQKCLRAGGKHNDLENVGETPFHHTFFEMLGNFAFSGDKLKESACRAAWEFLTEKLGFEEDRLYVSVFREDKEALSLWKEATGLPPDRILSLGEEDNFWRMGDEGPSGPCSEILYCREPKKRPAPEDLTEVWNLVFMEFFETGGGKKTPLKAPCIDTGMGLERLTALVQGKDSNYKTDLFLPILEALQESSGRSLAEAEKRAGEGSKPAAEELKAFLVSADHSRAAAFLISDGARPGNEGAGYVLRRILRRAFYYSRKLHPAAPLIQAGAEAVISLMKPVYPELEREAALVSSLIEREERRFADNLKSGRGLLLKKLKPQTKKLDPEIVWDLYSSYGFPFDLTRMIANEKGIAVDLNGAEDIKRIQSRLNAQKTLEKKDSLLRNRALKFAALWLKKEAEAEERSLALWREKDLAVKEVVSFLKEDGDESSGDDSALFDEEDEEEVLQEPSEDERDSSKKELKTEQTAWEKSKERGRILSLWTLPPDEKRNPTGGGESGAPFAEEREKRTPGGGKAGADFASGRERRAGEEGGGLDETGACRVSPGQEGTAEKQAEAGSARGSKAGREGSGADLPPAVLKAVLKKGERGFITTNRTCFYPEGGGPIGDCGLIKTERGRAQILDTQKEAEIIFHEAEVLEGELRTGDKALLETDKKFRARTAEAHSGTHLLNLALRRILGSKTKQAGSLVEPGRLRFDFTADKPLTEDQKDALEDTVNGFIQEGSETIAQIQRAEDAVREGAVFLPGENYSKKVRVVAMGDSKEFCGGIHVQNTKEIKAFKILSETGVQAGVRRIVALTGDGALEREKTALRELEELRLYLKKSQESYMQMSQATKEGSAKISGRENGRRETARGGAAKEDGKANPPPEGKGRRLLTEESETSETSAKQEEGGRGETALRKRGGGAKTVQKESRSFAESLPFTDWILQKEAQIKKLKKRLSDWSAKPLPAEKRFSFDSSLFSLAKEGRKGARRREKQNRELRKLLKLPALDKEEEGAPLIEACQKKERRLQALKKQWEALRTIDKEALVKGAQALSPGAGKSSAQSERGETCRLLVAELPVQDSKVLAALSDQLKDRLRSGIVVSCGAPSPEPLTGTRTEDQATRDQRSALAGRIKNGGGGESEHGSASSGGSETASFPVIVTVTKDLQKSFPAGEIMKRLAAPFLKGRGGGGARFASGKGSDLGACARLQDFLLQNLQKPEKYQESNDRHYKR